VRQEKYIVPVRTRRDEVRKVKAHLALNFARDMNGNKKGLYKHNSSKRRENVGLLLNGAEDLLIKDTEEANLLNGFCASVFIGRVALQEFQVLETRGKVWNRKD